MVTNVTSFSRSGLSDWLIQRVTGVIIAAYTIFIAVYLVFNPGLDFAQWQSLHQGLPMRLFSLATIVSIAAHAWIGLWAVLTDYVTVRLMGPKATPLRILLQLGMIVVTLAYVAWAIDILWGI
jgi:succinate dehydrogenase / fumarate reductase, membrane anchor subunit